MQLTISHLGFTYDNATEPLFTDINATFAPGWTAIIGDNGIGKTTLVKLICGQLPLQNGTITPKTSSLIISICVQQLDETPANLDDFAADWSPEALKIRRLLGIDDSWLYRFDTLSGGQAKRVQIACALQRDPDVLILDEPTNHVDAHTRAAIIDAMRAYSGVGIVISHDVTLIDATCTRCLSFERQHVDGHNITVAVPYQGNYSEAFAQMTQRNADSSRELARAKAETNRLRAVQAQRIDKVREAARAGNAHIDAKDHDARNARKMAKSTSLDSGVSSSLAQLNGRLSQAQAAQQGIATAAKRYEGDFWTRPVNAHLNEVAHLDAGLLRPGSTQVSDDAQPDDVTSELTISGNAWTIAGPEDQSITAIRIPTLSVGPTSHIGLTGDNGLGKSTVIAALAEHVNPLARALIIRQDTTQRDADDALARLRALPSEDRATVLSAYAQLNADPDKLLAGQAPSPGELRKLLLAMATVDDIDFIIMDEPTNHLDISSKQALARALANYGGALIVVSHDDDFIAAIETPAQA